MTPAARVSAAIEVLDRYLDGTPLEKALTNWGRQNRYAGSKDRAAVRDHVFSACRRMRSAAAIGGARTGRGLMIGLLSADGVDLQEVFTGDRFAPAPLTPEELTHLESCVEMFGDEAVDCPDWLWPDVVQALGAAASEVFGSQQSRAPTFLRVNLAKADLPSAQASLADDGIETVPHPTQDTALEIRSNPRRLQQSTAYTDGLVELQDASSQAISDFVPVETGQNILDLCAGGGGKTLAMAARVHADFYAHDIDPKRLAPIKERAKRAGVAVKLLQSDQLGRAEGFDGVLCDAPCSGSGSWRRSPEGKWSLTPKRLEELCQIQADILDQAASLVQPDGWIVYATCSVLACENEDQVSAFLKRNPGWTLERSLQFHPDEAGDGLYAALLRR
ncbi:RsmB/NOP family class I SAM-dependent RNA methyltransferase [Actibacterium pelagium]|uniref:SAM-dependent methyltransferase n=1 Tax=Actibacterium pelagium TaxID=2029103 RepID=A0A917ACQ9_9RHOB|nr:RsmB/NOP family class I SAM-dependent RNA methyltransferase [Actibacterium pelagium]GGE41917.1 SAM-dependent methyltransferase [Actibacterium pelagium]